EMATAAAAMHLGAHHAEAAVGRGLDRARHWIIEARPAGAALEFRLRDEQRLLAAGAYERAVTLLVVERAASRRLGAVLAHDPVLLGREQATPLGVGAGDWIDLGVHASSSVCEQYVGRVELFRETQRSHIRWVCPATFVTDCARSVRGSVSTWPARGG